MFYLDVLDHNPSTLSEGAEILRMLEVERKWGRYQDNPLCKTD